MFSKTSVQKRHHYFRKDVLSDKTPLSLRKDAILKKKKKTPIMFRKDVLDLKKRRLLREDTMNNQKGRPFRKDAKIY